MSTEIYYFSGTGNSLFVAKELAKRMPDAVILPIVSYLSDETVVTQGKTVGFVFPCHALTIPLAVEAFLKKLDTRSATYVFAVATRYGTVFKGFERIADILNKKNKDLDAQFILNMAHNEAPRSDPYYRVPTAIDLQQIEERVVLEIDEISSIINGKRVSHEKDEGVIAQSASNPVAAYLIERLVIFLMGLSKYLGGVNYFCHDDKCTGCGLCAKVCLSGKIKMINKEPVWQKAVMCFMCYGCVNFCPVQSVQVNDIPGVKSYTAQNGRYPHPYAKAENLVAQRTKVHATNRSDV